MLLWQNDLRLSSPTLEIQRDPIYKTEQIKGIGDVHFYFNGEEKAIFHKIFGIKNLMTVTTHWQTQPDGILAKIFEYVDPISSLNLSLVNKKANDLFLSPLFQERLLQLHHHCTLSSTLSPIDQYLALTVGQSLKGYSILSNKVVKLNGPKTSIFLTHPDLTQALTAEDEILYLWNLPEAQLKHMYVGHASPIRWIGLNTDDSCVTKSDSEIKIWDLKEKKCTKTITRKEIVESENVDIRPYHQQILSVSNTDVQLWDMDTENRLLSIKKEDVEFEPSLFLMSNDGKTTLICFENQTFKLYCLASGKCLLTIDTMEPSIDSVTMNDQSTKAYTTCEKIIKVWDLSTGALLQTIGSNCSEPILDLKITPDGNRIISNNKNGSLNVWHHATGKFIEQIYGQGGSLHCGQISSDGTRALIVHGQFNSLEFLNLSPLPHELVNEAAMNCLRWKSEKNEFYKKIHLFIRHNSNYKDFYHSPYSCNLRTYTDLCDYSEVFLPMIKKYLKLSHKVKSERDKKCYWETAYHRFNQLPTPVQMAIYNRMRLLHDAIELRGAETTSHEKNDGKESFHSKDEPLDTKIMAIEGTFTTVAEAKKYVHKKNIEKQTSPPVTGPLTRTRKRQRMAQVSS